MPGHRWKIVTASSVIALTLGMASGEVHASLGDYGNKICQIESNCRNDATNDNSTATGRYQFTQAALKDVGWFEGGSVTSDDYGAGEWTNGEWKENEFGVSSREDFMSNQAAQDYVFEQYTKNNWNAMERNGALDYAGSTINGIVIDDAALLAGAHLLGPQGMKDFLANGGFSEETLRNHPNIEQLLAERAEMFSGTDVSELTGRESQTGQYAGEIEGGFSTADMEQFYCDPEIAQILAQSAQQAVDSQVALASMEGVGYSQPPESYGFLSCLEDLLSGGVDTVFTPPTLGDILGMLEDFICEQADELYTEVVEKPINESLAMANQSIEGFAPVPGMGEFITGSSVKARFNRRANSDNPIDRLSVGISGSRQTGSRQKTFEQTHEQLSKRRGSLDDYIRADIPGRRPGFFGH